MMNFVGTGGAAPVGCRPVLSIPPEDRHQDHGTSLSRAFEAAGGVVSADQLVLLLRDTVQQPLSLVARWLVKREVISFRTFSQTLLPLFQLDLRHGEIKAGARQAIREWGPVADDAEMARWFAMPNAWLGGRIPAVVLDSELTSVLDALRADRLSAFGMAATLTAGPRE